MFRRHRVSRYLKPNTSLLFYRNITKILVARVMQGNIRRSDGGIINGVVCGVIELRFKFVLVFLVFGGGI